MSAAETRTPATGACTQCRRRSWLLWQLSGPLDYLARDRGRLSAVLALPDAELIQAAGGSRRNELCVQYESLADNPNADAEHTEACFCRHHRSYPAALSDAGAPALLYSTGSVRALLALLAKPMVAIVGSAMPSDYGIAMAGALGRGLARSGVTVIAVIGDGVAVAALAGALRGAGAPLAIAGHGLRVPPAIRHRHLRRDVAAAGCVVSELTPECQARRWGAIAAERILARLAVVTVVVEAEDSPAELAVACMAQMHGSTLAAVPGRVTSPLSSGANALLAQGARLIRDTADVLELLSENEDPQTPLPTPGGDQHGVTLTDRLQDVLDQVGAGRDTPARLTVAGSDDAGVLLALTELEVIGLLTRGAGGRYVPTEPCTRPTRYQ